MANVNRWNAKLCGCTDDIKTCLCGWCCGPCLFGTMAERIDGKNCFGMCCLYMILTQCALCWVPHFFERKKLREKYKLEEDPACGDCPTTACCGPCAICQATRELDIRENASLRSASRGGAAIISQPQRR